jgi:fatty-acyl-CoA synthase
MRNADFANLAEALDYAATGSTGYNFYTGRGDLWAVLPYRELREQARSAAQRLQGLGLQRGARVALVAETHPDFMRLFFACQYVGLVPVPLPVNINLGSRTTYVRQLRRQLRTSRAAIGIASESSNSYLQDASEGLGMRFVGTPAQFDALQKVPLGQELPEPGELAYLQFTSGSTRFPRGVMITQQAVLSNLQGIIRHGVEITPQDRCMSWLPYYHDMGLVGTVLAPLASQRSVDYMGVREFSMRPQQWLALIARNRATISFAPPFAYDLVRRRLRPEDAGRFDLSAWRVAGVGAEPIRPEVLTRFAEALATSGFDARAFLPSYGMAEASLAVSFPPLGSGLSIDQIDADYHRDHRVARPVVANSEKHRAVRTSEFVNCGTPLPGLEVEIRDPEGNALTERHTGLIFLRGSSLMSGYFNDPDTTRATLAANGWLNTGDLGYWVGTDLHVTGRSKDMIIINGRNIWPEDLEYIAEQQPETRTGDALAYAAPGPEGNEMAILLVQNREADTANHAELVTRLESLIRQELAIDCHVQLVPPHTLPHTSSGKRSRSRARKMFLSIHARKRGPAQPETPHNQDKGAPTTLFPHLEDSIPFTPKRSDNSIGEDSP